ncbi:hypothetical protein QE361_000416 [Sphingomonas sp. SORGH_AS802]|jgi:hypothetical protein|uniref:hypothetical protein n=1 Tax=unclassified Sphingomonas TaxID=196159 RepID=UPI00285E8098|nr:MULTISPECIES: hypothetical protein [unclassified Sphingomonas]MDR6127629.1 hypothetical protein [Sphingomonas sp. SORGH_AS_0438]MDR6133458.1 hypothetical protein [Sphingomonas sp. SORGH_AS_0802]
MTSEKRRAAIIGLIEQYTETHLATPDTARAALINEGIYTKAGKLRAEYGGSGKKTLPA